MITTIPVPETSPASGYYPSPDAPRGEFNRPPTGSQNSETLPPHNCQLHYLGEIVGVDGVTHAPVTEATNPAYADWWVFYRQKSRTLKTRWVKKTGKYEILTDDTQETMIWDAQPNADPNAPPSFPKIQIPEYFPPGTRQYRFGDFVTNSGEWGWLFSRFGEYWSETWMSGYMNSEFMFPLWWHRGGYTWYENSMGDKVTPCDHPDIVHLTPPEAWADVVEEQTIKITHGWCRMIPYTPKTGNLIPVYAAAGALAGDVVCGASGGFGGGGALLLLMAAAAGAAAMSGSSAAAAGRKKQKRAESV